ncbi:MAG: AAA family ATPase [Sideroxydans sp.]|nr:AAA family ATPase [Sideroxydans sp.]
MYLEHFGLNEQPFKITPVTEFFFDGANRKDILDALIYSISEVEGIIKVSGEVGSGKTMLCRMLLEKLPKHIEPIYLANPSLSREEMLYAVADALGLNIEHERVGVILQNIQNVLEKKAREGKRVVVLVDEAHAMPLDTLEELRLIYNLQVGSFKLIQIVLFGQPELNAKLDQPNMRQLKDRIVHHFNMHPLSRDILENYLMFRMRKAGYHGPNIFSAKAVKLIADASAGLMRRANVLADKSLLAAFVADTHNIEVCHVQAALRDSELEVKASFSKPQIGLMAGAVAATLTALAVALWPSPLPVATVAHISPTASSAVALSAPLANTLSASDVPAIAAVSAPVASSAVVSADSLAAASAVAPPSRSLVAQRLSAGEQLLGAHHGEFSLQLFYNATLIEANLEGFLQRAAQLGCLEQIYLLPVTLNNKQGVRVLYGAYPSSASANLARAELPERYKKAFSSSIYALAAAPS